MIKKLEGWLQSKAAKKTGLGLGIGFMVVTIFITVNPGPFLKFGYAGVFLFNALSGPGMILLPTLSRHMNFVILAFVSALGMAINDSVSWLVGRNGSVILPRLKKIIRLEAGINKYGPWALLVWSMIPFPYDLIGLISGYLGFSYIRFLVPTFAGKFIRFLMVAGGSLAIFNYF